MLQVSLVLTSRDLDFFLILPSQFHTEDVVALHETLQGREVGGMNDDFFGELCDGQRCLGMSMESWSRREW
jgi:hypothetical protein